METTSPKCPVCAQDAVGGVVSCPRCAVAHHFDCWEYQDRRCAIYGCAPPLVPPSPPPPGRSWGTIAYVVVALFLAMARGTSRSHRSYEPPPVRIPTVQLELPQGRYVPPPFEIRALPSARPIDPSRVLSPGSRKILEEMVAKGQISCRILHGRLTTCPRCAKK